MTPCLLYIRRMASKMSDMTTPTRTTYTKPQPVLVLGAITSGLTFFFGGITLVAGLQENPTVALIAGLGTLATGAVNVGKDYYLKGQVTPMVDTAAYRNEDGVVVTGPAASGNEGVPAVVATDGTETIYRSNEEV